MTPKERAAFDDRDEEDLERINKEWPKHCRTSCNDDDLYNSGTVFYRHRCERCEALDRLRLRVIEREYKRLTK